MKFNPTVLVAAALLLAVAVVLYIIGHDDVALAAITAGLALLVPSTKAG